MSVIRIITGDDLIEIGIGEGPEIGHTLNKLLDLVIVNPDININEKLKELAKQI